MRKFIVYLLFMALAVLFLAGIVSCTPEGMIRYATKRKPSLIKGDSTVKTTIKIHKHLPADTTLNKAWFLEQLSKLKKGDTLVIHNHYITQKYYSNSDGSIGEREITPADTSLNTTVEKNGIVITEKNKTDLEQIKEIVFMILIGLGIIELVRIFRPPKYQA
jgi:sortase (surface protein transpeptidase)